MKRREHFSVGPIVAGVVGVVLILGFAVSQSLGARKWHSNFDGEMAQRLDLEEKLMQMDKERSALLANAKDLTARLERSKAEAEELKSALAVEREGAKVLEKRLEQVQTPVLTSTTK